jgi:hypothetical protein
MPEDITGAEIMARMQIRRSFQSCMPDSSPWISMWTDTFRKTERCPLSCKKRMEIFSPNNSYLSHQTVETKKHRSDYGTVSFYV